MKLLAVILVLTIAAQPVQAGICDMMQPDSQADMHAGMQHDGGDAAAGHDCCEPDGDGQASDCDNMVRCGSCVAGVAGIAMPQSQASSPAAIHLTPLGAGSISPSHTTPPFRPPTHIS